MFFSKTQQTARPNQFKNPFLIACGGLSAGAKTPVFAFVHLFICSEQSAIKEVFERGSKGEEEGVERVEGGG